MQRNAKKRGAPWVTAQTNVFRRAFERIQFGGQLVQAGQIRSQIRRHDPSDDYAAVQYHSNAVDAGGKMLQIVLPQGPMCGVVGKTVKKVLQRNTKVVTDARCGAIRFQTAALTARPPGSTQICPNSPLRPLVPL